MLADKERDDIAEKFIRNCGGYSDCEEAIPYIAIEDFGRAIEELTEHEQNEYERYIRSLYGEQISGEEEKEQNNSRGKSLEEKVRKLFKDQYEGDWSKSWNGEL